jgi:hypothetical protein
MKTAVEYLYKNLLDNPMSNEDVIYNINVFEQAKEMEKEQIVKAAYEFMGTNFDSNMGRAEKYYNQTFKQQE